MFTRATIAIACLGASSAREQLGLDEHAADNPFKSFFKGFASKEHVSKGEKFLKSEHVEDSKTHKSATNATHRANNTTHTAKKVNRHKELSNDSSLNAQLDEIAQSFVVSPSSKAQEKQQKAHVEAMKVEMRATHRVCDPQEEGCTSMCQWLKMTDREINGQCPLFEWQLKSCDYTPPGERVDGAEPEPLDCAVDLMRTNVLEPDVPNYINQLDVCIEGLPTRVNATCYVGLGLLRSEIGDWKAEAELKQQALVLSNEIGNVTEIAREALNTKTQEQEAIDELTRVLSEAEELPGHYLVEEVHEARGYLDLLGPFPAVR